LVVCAGWAIPEPVNPLPLVLAAAAATPSSPTSPDGLPPWAHTATASLIALLSARPSDSATEQRYAAAPIESDEPTVEIGGALRFIFSWNSWDGDIQTPSASSFDTFRFDIDGRYADLYFSAQYRFYAGYNMLQHGYIGSDLIEESMSVKVGVTQVPFGILPFASHNFFFSILYYVGLEDDYDLGVSTKLEAGNFDLHFAFFKNDEGHFSGNSLDSARYSYDLVRTNPGDLASAGIPEARNLEETNQTNARAAWTLEHATGYRTELGVSGQLGQTFDGETERLSRHWALAGHLDGQYGWFDLHLEAGHYDIGLDARAAGDPRLVAMGAYDAPYAVAAEASFILANIALEVPWDVWLLDSITFYQDYSGLLKAEDAFADSHQIVWGTLIAAGPIFTYLDWAFGRNHPWLGPDYNAALGPGDPDAPWELRFNVNVGWYF
jgi:hypothetical protein